MVRALTTQWDVRDEKKKKSHHILLIKLRHHCARPRQGDGSMANNEAKDKRVP